MTEALFLPERDQKLILAYELALLLQINLYSIKTTIKGNSLLLSIKSGHRTLLVSLGYDCPLNKVCSCPYSVNLRKRLNLNKYLRHVLA